MQGFYYDADLNRYFKITDEMTKNSRVKKLTKVTPNILMEPNTTSYIKNRAEGFDMLPLKYEPQFKQEFRYDADQYIVMDTEVILFSTGVRLMIFESGGIKEISLHDSKVSKLQKITEFEFIYCTLGSAKPGSVYHCLFDCNYTHLSVNNLTLRRGSAYSCAYSACCVVASEKSVLIYDLSFNFKKKCHLSSDVLSTCCSTSGIILSSRNGQLLLFDPSTLKISQLYKCDTHAEICILNDVLYACTPKTLYIFDKLKLATTHDCALDRLFISGEHLVETDDSVTIIRHLTTISEIELVLAAKCNQFISTSCGYIFNSEYCRW
eukprot:NODE_222_length_13951_cov_0.396982.p6 type:complete len:322 gc:universal NODE_222_length_13951_cov_0.396982:4852-5817(+)